ncbi:hypothetical protein FHG87_022556 [Trinorchestia longiramus]|nr:hypothetical protein FHG87_022556 [Trinorchestia longiramus]
MYYMSIRLDYKKKKKELSESSKEVHMNLENGTETPGGPALSLHSFLHHFTASFFTSASFSSQLSFQLSLLSVLIAHSAQSAHCFHLIVALLNPIPDHIADYIPDHIPDHIADHIADHILDPIFDQILYHYF